MKYSENINKSEKVKKPDELTRLLLPSFIGILICAVLLTGLSFAWFTANERYSSTIVAGRSDIRVLAKADGSDEYSVVASASRDTTQSLAAGTYSFMLVENDTQIKTSYCKITIGEKAFIIRPYSTDADGERILGAGGEPTGASYDGFTVTAGTDVKFEFGWGYDWENAVSSRVEITQ